MRDSFDSGRAVSVSRCNEHVVSRPCARAMTHGHASVAFYTGGSSLMEQRGEWQVRAGDVLLIPSGEPHRMLSGRAAEYWGLGFFSSSFSSTSGSQDHSQLLAPFERVRAGATAVVPIPHQRHAYLDTLFQELERQTRVSSGSGENAARVENSLLTLILHEIHEAASTLGPVASSTSTTPAAGFVAESLRFIERHCFEKLTLNEVARAVGRTPAYVTHTLKRATGRSVGEWISHGRMAEARRLLLHSEELVDVIAGRVGYADVTHFIRTFRRAHGTTPAKWRSEARAKALRSSLARP